MMQTQRMAEPNADTNANTGLAKITGHATEAMTHHYSHVDEAEKLEAQRRAFAVVAGTKNENAGAKNRNENKGPKEGIKEGMDADEGAIQVHEAFQVC